MIGSFIRHIARNYVFHGDSHTYGNADTTNAWPLLLSRQGLFSENISNNFAQNGWSVDDVNSDYTTRVTPFEPNATGVTGTYWLHIGSNDITNGATGINLFSAVNDVITRAKAGGFVTGITTIWGATSYSSPQNTQRTIFNNFIVNFGSQDFLFRGDQTFTNPASQTYFLPDAAHLNPIGQKLYADSVYSILHAARNI